MKLTRLAWHNLHNRGTRGQLSIAPVTMLVGKNDAGKTTILNLPRLLLDGPKQGDWPAVGEARYPFNVTGGWALDGGDRMVLDRGRSSEGTHLVSVDGNPQKVTAAAIEVGRVAGKAWGLSISELVALTGRFRMDWLHANVLRAPWPLDQVEADLVEAGVDAAWLRGFVWGEAPIAGQSLPGQDFTKRAIAVLETEDKVNEAKIRTLRGAVEQIQPPPPDLPTGTVAEWRSKLEALTAEGHELNRRSGEIQGATTARAAFAKQVAVVEAKLGALPSDESLRIKHSRAVGERDRAVAAVETQRARVVAPELDLEQQTTELRRMETEHSDLYKQVAELDDRLRVAMNRAAAVDLLPDVFAAIDRLVTELGGKGASYRTLDALRAAADDARSGHRSEDYAELADLRQRMAALHTAVTQANARVERAYQNEQLAEAELSRLAKAVTGWRETVEMVERERADVQVRREALLADLAQLREQTEAVQDDDSAALADALLAARERHKEITRVIDRLNDAASDQARAAEHQFNLSTATAVRGRIRDALTALRDVRARWADKEMAELLAPACELTQAVIGMGLTFRPDDDARISLVGTVGQMIDLETASHSQRTIAYVALYVAMVRQLRGWRAVILDDLEHLEKGRRTALFVYLRDLVDQGGLDQVIGAAVADGWAAPPGVHLTRIGPRE